MENTPKEEAFVPNDKQETFAAESMRGKYMDQKSEEFTERAAEARAEAKSNANIAAGFAGAAALSATTGFTENPVALPGVIGATIFGIDAFKALNKSRDMSKKAVSTNEKKEESYGISRSIVEEGIEQTPAEDVIKIAREQMNADLDAQELQNEEYKEAEGKA